jgi:tetratricopeptide (TPR) repeat protein
LKAWLYNNEAMVDLAEHQVLRGLGRHEQALALKQKFLAPDHPDIAGSLNNEANALTTLGRNEEALHLNERAYDIFVRAYGPSSIEAGYMLSNRGECLVALGRPRDALQPLATALRIFEAQVGGDHPYVGYALTASGRALLALGRPEDAVPTLERALRVRAAHEPDPSLVAETRFALARALWGVNPDWTRPRELAMRARDAYLKATDTKDAAEIAAWLATRARPRQVH